jgi:hypothetical protein
MSRNWTFAIALLLAGSPPLFTLALTDQLTVLLVACFGVGVVSAAINPIITSTMFERVPEPMHARV